MVEFSALWDTGATNSVISRKVVDACGLKSTGVERVYHAQGEAVVETYLVDITLPTHMEVHGLPVISGAPQGMDVLIGMDIIGAGDFVVTNRNGRTKFSFRIPSQGDTDFSDEGRQPSPG